MIASRLGVAIVTALAVLLAVVVALGRSTRTGAPERVVLGIDPSAVRELAWTYTDGTPATRIRRDPASRTGWSWVEPAGNADADAVDAVLAALRAARWHRRADADAAGAQRATLAITTDDATHTLAVAEKLAGTEQQWIRRDDDALLVDAWVARALVPDRLGLRVRAPLTGASSAKDIRIVRAGRELRLAGQPRSAHGFLLAPSLADAIHTVVSDLTLVRVAVVTRADPPGMRVELDSSARWIEEAGPCPGEARAIAVVTSDGGGCIAAEAWTSVAAAADALEAPPAELVERRPLPFEAAQLALPDGSRIDLAKRPRIGERDADPVRVAELLAVLAAPAEPVDVPASRPAGRLTLTDRTGAQHALILHGNGLVARAGEPVALRVGDGAYALLVRAGTAYRDPAIWSEDPATISALTLGPTTYRRGAVLGEWSRTGPGRDEPRAVERLVELVSRLRALDPPTDPKAAPTAARHELTLTVSPPAGSTAIRHLTVVASATACVVETSDPRETHHVNGEVCRLVERLTAL
ncbi:MAG: hypothetical protein KF773_37215 [Deltaproteobacteria bacterium]|nr:hypothetical protein [Deltaproteobacteria bacterium]